MPSLHPWRWLIGIASALAYAVIVVRTPLAAQQLLGRSNPRQRRGPKNSRMYVAVQIWN
jgi:hypothetical protein